MNKIVSVHVVSDTICPWCYVGKRRLERALALVPDIEVSVHWRPYQLDKTIPEGGMDRQAYLTRKFGASGAERVYDRIRVAGREEGIPFAFEAIKRTPNTIASHRLFALGEEAGVQDSLSERLFRLYFVEGADIGDTAVLADAAAFCGMDRDKTLARLASDESRSHVLREIAMANDLGIDGVPCFIFEGHVFLPGAQPVEVIAETIRRVAHHGTGS